MNSPSDWEEWFNRIHDRAATASVWSFMNPSTPKEQLPTLTKTPLPKPEDVNPQKKLISELTVEEREKLQTLREDHRE